MLKVLLVEDNEMSSEMLSRRLMRRGYRVSIADNGESALLNVNAEKPNIIIMDLNLPGIDGLEITRRLKANKKTTHIPVIACTAHALSDDHQKALKAGCDDYVTKPVDLEKLLIKINNLILAK